MRYDVGRFRRPMRRSTEGQLMSLISLGDGSTLSLDFTTGVLDPRLTFTRTSNATFINSSGLVQYAFSNRIPNSASLSGFGAVGVTAAADSNEPGPVVAPSGTQATKVTVNGGATTVNFSRNFGTGAGTSTGMTYSIYLKPSRLNNGSGFRYAIRNETTGLNAYGVDVVWANSPVTVNEVIGAADGDYQLIGPDANGWYRLILMVTNTGLIRPGDNLTVYAGYSGQGTGFFDASGAYWVWGAQLEPGLTASPVYLTGATSTGYFDVPRFDHDPTTGAPQGLLVEGTATNVLVGFTAGGWGRQNIDGSGTAGALANGQTGPDGVANTAARITTAAATTFPANMFVAFATNAAGASRTFSVWLRGVGSNTTASIAIVGSNTPTGVASSQSGHSVTLTTSTSGNNLLALVTGLSTTAWTRVSISRTDAQASADSYRICPGNHTGTISSGLAVDVYVVQAESGIGMSSTIPTGASTVQRLADSCSIVSPNFSTWYNQGEGTFLLHCQLNRIGAQHLLNVNVNNAAPRLMITETSSQFNAATENPSGTNFNLALGSSSTNAAKVIAAFKNLDVAGTRNGATVQTSTAMTVPTTVNLLRIGSAEGGYQYMTGTVSLLKYWPTRLPNAQLQSLTT